MTLVVFGPHSLQLDIENIEKQYVTIQKIWIISPEIYNIIAIN